MEAPPTPPAGLFQSVSPCLDSFRLKDVHKTKMSGDVDKKQILGGGFTTPL